MTPRCLNRLQEVHPDLQRIILRGSEIYQGEFIVTEGKRTKARQKELYDAKATTTMRSRHVPESNASGLPCAVDLAVKVGTEIRWDWPLYKIVADAIKQAAEELGLPIEWGGDWRTFKDGPHFQLPWKDYP